MTAALAREAERARPREAQATWNAEAIADSAVQCLLLELETWPKPGLVSHVDNGSHDDMDAGTFRRSAAASRARNGGRTPGASAAPARC